jgi:hypothetical protein
MTRRPSIFISPAQQEKITDALSRAAAARRRANGATRGLKKILANLTKSPEEAPDTPEPPPPAS